MLWLSMFHSAGGICQIRQTIVLRASMFRGSDGAFEKKEYALKLQFPAKSGDTGALRLEQFNVISAVVSADQ